MTELFKLYINSKETTDVGHDEFKPENYVERREENTNQNQDKNSGKKSTNALNDNKEEIKHVVKTNEDEEKGNGN